MSEAMGDIQRACVEVLKAKKLKILVNKFGISPNIVLRYGLPILDKTGKNYGILDIQLDIFSSSHDLSIYSYSIISVTNERMNDISEFIARVNNNTIFAKLHLDFDKQSISIKSHNYFGEHCNLDDVKGHLLVMIDEALKLYRECFYPISRLLTYKNMTVKTAYQEYEKLAKYDLFRHLVE